MRRSLLPVLGCLVLACASYEGARHYGSGTRALERGDAAVAVAELERAAELMPEASEVHNHLGIAYLEDGREGEALAAFRRAVRLDCDNGAAQQNLDVLEARLGLVSVASDTPSDGVGDAP